MARVVTSAMLVIVTHLLLIPLEIHGDDRDTLRSDADSRCEASITTRTLDRLEICHSLPVDTNLDLRCDPMPLHVIFGILHKAEDPDWAQKVALDVFQEVTRHPSARVGVVVYGERVYSTVDLTADHDAIERILKEGVSFTPGVSGYPIVFDQASKKAIEMFEAARPDPALLPVQPKEVFVLFGASVRNHSRTMIQRADRMIRDAQLELLVGCAFGQVLQCEDVREILVHDEDKYAESPGDRTKLPRAMQREVAALVAEAGPREASVTHDLPAFLEYEPDSASIVPASVTRTITGTRLAWIWPAPPPTAAYSLTYRARPLAEGSGAITGHGAVALPDGSRQLIPMPSRPITVSGLCITPTAEPTATATPTQVPTATATPTATVSATPTATASATATQVPAPLFLPLLLKTQGCTPETRSADVVLVIDTSNSMSESTSPGGPTKLEAAREAAKTFVSQLVAGRDQAAVVQFNGTAELLAGLAPDPALAAAALDRLAQGGGTRIDLGLDTAGAALAGPGRRAGNNAVVILLTDGRPSGVTDEGVREAGRRLRAAGVLLLFTIGLGQDIDEALLGEIASRPDWYYPAPDTGDLAAIYARIAYAIPCRPDWP